MCWLMYGLLIILFDHYIYPLDMKIEVIGVVAIIFIGVMERGMSFNRYLVDNLVLPYYMVNYSL